MNCPDKEIIQDLVDGELSQDDARPVIEHIQTCKSCKNQLREIFVLHNTLSTIVQQDACPQVETLESYAEKTYPAEKVATVKEHVDLCARCRSYVWAFGASEEEMAQWQAQEEQSYREYLAQSPGYIAAKETLSKLLPAKLELLDKGWQSIVSWVSDLKDKAIESWPSLNQGVQLAGVLGFAETSDPQTEATSIILTTTLYVSEAISDGTIINSQEDIEATVKEVAAKLGAGKELQKRLLETVPTVVLNIHRGGDV